MNCPKCTHPMSKIIGGGHVPRQDCKSWFCAFCGYTQLLIEPTVALGMRSQTPEERKAHNEVVDELMFKSDMGNPLSQPNPPTEAEIAAAKELEARFCDERMGHTASCDNDFCALSGGPDDCEGIVERDECPLTIPEIMCILMRHNAPLHAQVAEAVIAMTAISEASIKQAKDHAKIIADQHAKLAVQKAALELAQEAIEAIAEFPMPNSDDSDYNCVVCYSSSKEGHKPDCKYVTALSAIKEALQ